MTDSDFRSVGEIVQDILGGLSCTLVTDGNVVSLDAERLKRNLRKGHAALALSANPHCGQQREASGTSTIERWDFGRRSMYLPRCNADSMVLTGRIDVPMADAISTYDGPCP